MHTPWGEDGVKGQLAGVAPCGTPGELQVVMLGGRHLTPAISLAFLDLITVDV